MCSKTTLYRREHPEYYEEEKKRDNERMKAKYANDPIRRERAKQIALAYYYKKKAEKQNISTSINTSIQVI
jgi:hypothetical protein